MGRDLVILCYHAVSDIWPAVEAVTPAALERQLMHLLERGYRPATLSAALADPSRRTVAVTFDDAFQSVVDRGLPLLERLGVSATLYVPTDFADEAAPMTWSKLTRWIDTEHEHELRCMSWEGVRHLAAAGWEIGSHTCSHPKLTEIGPAAAREELRRSKQRCEDELQAECFSLAYPFGLHDGSVVAVAGEAGYGSAVTLGERLLGPRRRHLFELSREGIYRTTPWPHFRAAASPFLGRLRATGLYAQLAA